MSFLYSSAGLLAQKHLRPLLIFLHGGGLVALSTAAYDKLVRRMTNLIGAANGVVVSIDYRLRFVLSTV